MGVTSTKECKKGAVNRSAALQYNGELGKERKSAQKEGESVCVCVCEREREREVGGREKEKPPPGQTNINSLNNQAETFPRFQVVTKSRQVIQILPR